MKHVESEESAALPSPQYTECWMCKGSGEIAPHILDDQPCWTCRGKGYLLIYPKEKNLMTFPEWIEELKVVACEQGFTKKGITNTDWKALEPYYIDGLTPTEALAEDLSNA